MRQYTELLDDRAFLISPEDDDYEEQLLRTAALFRPFDQALDAFLVWHGFDGGRTGPDARVDFLRERFRRADIPFPRGVRDWFARGKRPERDTAFQLCFAFGLDVEGTRAFFREVYLERSFDCHAVREAVYFYCIRNGLSYGEAGELMGQIKKVPVGRLAGDREILYTGTILEQLRHITRKEDLVRYLNDNIEKFRYNNATATSYIRRLWDTIAGPGGLACLESRLILQPEAEEDRRVTVAEEGSSVWNVYAQILGLDRYQRARLVGDRSIKAVLRDNALLHPLAEASFPDRDGIHKVLNGAHVSNERVRKLLILLVFYAYWAGRLTEGGSSRRARPGDAGRCLASLDRYLLDAGYPELYLGNPYDWIFLWALRDDYPLDAFRSYIGELFAVKSEQSPQIQPEE